MNNIRGRQWISPTCGPHAVRIRATRDVAFSRMTRVLLRNPTRGLIFRNNMYGAPFFIASSGGGAPPVSSECRNSSGQFVASSCRPTASILEDATGGAEKVSDIAPFCSHGVVCSVVSATLLVKYSRYRAYRGTLFERGHSG